MRRSSFAVADAVQPLKYYVGRSVVAFLFFFAVFLVIFTNADQNRGNAARSSISDFISQVVAVVSSPFQAVEFATDNASGILSVYSDNARLRYENTQLQKWQSVALKLETENKKLRNILNSRPAPGLASITAEVTAEHNAPFSKTAVIKSEDLSGVKPGMAVVSASGLIGRITEVGSKSARVLLISDINSRIPVVTQSSGQKSILAGKNRRKGELMYVKNRADLKKGELVVTTGDGGYFPPGIVVGNIGDVSGEVIKVLPSADLSDLDYVSIIIY